jgi:hypothetical protein
MHGILLLLCGIVVVFCAVIYVVLRFWRRMSAGKRIASVLLLAPYFLLIVSFAVSLACGHPRQGSDCFNRQFVCGVLIVFILPVPTLVGTVAALVLATSARRGS